MRDSAIYGRILKSDSWFEGTLLVEGGRIAEIVKGRPLRSAAGEFHDFGNSYIMPGVVDTHVHLRDPGMTGKEDFFTGTRSAAFGGVTTVLDMPNTLPPVTDFETLDQKNKIASQSSVVDYGLYLGILDDNRPDIVDDEAFSRGGVPGPAAYKCFMGRSTGGMVLSDLNRLGPVAKYAEKVSRKLAVHPEDGSVLARSEKKNASGGLLKTHLKRRPPLAESTAISKLKRICGGSPGPVHLLHVSSEDGIREATGSGFSLEVTPHHLFLDIDSAGRLENPALGKVNPPLRRSSDRSSLWSALNSGVVNTIGSDHAPHTVGEKDMGIDSPSGMPGVETTLPLLLNEVRSRRINIIRLLELLCHNPRKLFGIRRKGSLHPGYDADVVVFDPSRPRKIRSEELHSKCGWTAFEGMEGIFPEAVFSRGELIVEGENLVAKAGRGENIAEYRPDPR